MVDNSAYAICYVTHGWGGAAQTYERAKKKGLKITDVGKKRMSQPKKVAGGEIPLPLFYYHLWF